MGLLERTPRCCPIGCIWEEPQHSASLLWEPLLPDGVVGELGLLASRPTFIPHQPWGRGPETVQVKEGKKIEGAAILEDGKTRFLWAFPWIGPRISHRFLDYSLQFPSVDSKVTQMLVLIWAEGTTFLSGSIFSLDCRTSGPNM